MLKYAGGMTDYNWGQSLLTVPGLQHHTDLLVSAVTDELVFLSVTGYSAYAASLRTRRTHTLRDRHLDSRAIQKAYVVNKSVNSTEAVSETWQLGLNKRNTKAARFPKRAQQKQRKTTCFSPPVA